MKRYRCIFKLSKMVWFNNRQEIVISWWTSNLM